MACSARRLAGLAAVLLAVVVLAACSRISGVNPFKKEEEKLPGERISIMKAQDTPQVSETASKRPVALPPARRNDVWTQPGGVATNAPGHLTVGGSMRTAWRADAGEGSSDDGRITASPIVYQKKIFAIDAEGNVSAFSASSGSRVWRVDLAPENEKGEEGYGGGLAADDGRLYAVTGFGTVVAMKPSNGEIIWTQKIGVPIRTSPTAVGGKVYFVTSESRLHCLQGSDGTELWSFRGLPASATLLSNVSPAVAGDTVVVPYPSGDIVAYSASQARPVWVDSLSRRRGGSSLASLSDPARPVIDRGVVFAVGHSGRMVATSQGNGERLWTKNIRGTQTPWVAGDAVFLVDTNGKLMALGRSDGEVRWMLDLPNGGKWNGPVLASGKLWLASEEGLLVSVDAKTGTLGSQVDLDTPVFIAPVVASGRMYVLTDKARLVALN
ncbi:MAG: PQQ-binding-like beta-propeller repeat protein [Hyphomicrobiales bacterium]|nr:PQQ-binding-like beta-propeller repeat protein [Hyphomicrobiales bacterium]